MIVLFAVKRYVDGMSGGVYAFSIDGVEKIAIGNANVTEKEFGGSLCLNRA